MPFHVETSVSLGTCPQRITAGKAPKFPAASESGMEVLPQKLSLAATDGEMPLQCRA
jgi:hypothetical protein